MYGEASAALKPPHDEPDGRPRDSTATAEMCPILYAMVSTVRPKAKQTPRKPNAHRRKAPASTAPPQPRSTSETVQRIRARTWFVIAPSFSW